MTAPGGRSRSARVLTPLGGGKNTRDHPVTAFGGDRVGAARRAALAGGVAPVIGWLLSDAASWVNGALSSADGEATAVSHN